MKCMNFLEYNTWNIKLKNCDINLLCGKNFLYIPLMKNLIIFIFNCVLWNYLNQIQTYK